MPVQCNMHMHGRVLLLLSHTPVAHLARTCMHVGYAASWMSCISWMDVATAPNATKWAQAMYFAVTVVSQRVCACVRGGGEEGGTERGGRGGRLSRLPHA